MMLARCALEFAVFFRLTVAFQLPPDYPEQRLTIRDLRKFDPELFPARL